MTENEMAGVRTLIESRLTEIEEERLRLERAIQALGGSAKNSDPRLQSSNGGKRRASKRRGRRGARSKEVLDFIHAHPETTATIISEAIGISSTHVNGIVGKLRKEKKVAKGTPLRVC